MKKMLFQTKRLLTSKAGIIVSLLVALALAAFGYFRFQNSTPAKLAKALKSTSGTAHIIGYQMTPQYTADSIEFDRLTKEYAITESATKRIFSSHVASLRLSTVIKPDSITLALQGRTDSLLTAWNGELKSNNQKRKVILRTIDSLKTAPNSFFWVAYHVKKPDEQPVAIDTHFAVVSDKWQVVWHSKN